MVRRIESKQGQNRDHNSVQIGLQMDFKSNLNLEYYLEEHFQRTFEELCTIMQQKM